MSARSTIRSSRFSKKQIILSSILGFTGLMILFLTNIVTAQTPPDEKAGATPDSQHAARALPATSATVGYWQFDEGMGTTTRNGVSAILTATLSGASWVTDTATLGTSNPFALSLDGVDDFVEISDDNRIDFNTQQDFTVAVWAKPGVNSDSEEPIIDKRVGVTSVHPYSIRYVPATGAVVASRSDGTNTPTLTSTIAINDGGYHQITFVRSGGSSGTLSLYVDGAMQGSVQDTATVTTTNSVSLIIGRNHASTNFFAGAIDDLRIHNHALSYDKIRALAPAATCGQDGYLFPYTITTARPTPTDLQLRRAIACANLSSSPATIDLNNQTIAYSDSYPTVVGSTSLPDIMTPITITKGSLNRSHGYSNTFRHFHVTNSGDLTLRSVQVQRGNLSATNAVDQYGGGIYVNGGRLLVENSQMTYNAVAGTTYGLGGAIAATNGATVLVNNSYIASGAARSGGGIYTENSSVTINNSTVRDNNTSGDGGALFNRDSQLVLNHVTIDRNNALNGSSLAVSSNTTAPQTTFNNTLIANPNASASADCVQALAPSAPQPIYYTPGNNIDRDGTCATLAGAGFTTYGTAGLPSNPSFHNTTRYLPLQSNSPAINAGNNASIPSDPRFQFDVRGTGNPRIVNGTVDIGAHEYNKFGRVTIVKVAHPTDGTDFTFASSLPTAATFTLDMITPQDGDAHSDRRVVNHVLAGSYTITETLPANWSLTGATCVGTSSPAVRNGSVLTLALGESQEATCQFTNLLIPTGSCQVEVNGDNVTDFSSSDGSALQSAVDAASAGDILKVAGGCTGVQSRNMLTQTVYLDKSLMLIGGFTATNWLAAANPTVNPTVIDAVGQGRGLYATQTKLTLRDITIMRGTAQDGGGVYFDRSVATLDNVTIIGSSATRDGGAVYQVNGSTTLRNVSLTSNLAARNGGGLAAYGGHFAIEQSSEFAYNQAAANGGGVYSDGASQFALDSSAIRYNSSQDGGGLYNVGKGGVLITNGTFEHNQATSEGGGVYIDDDAIIENSTIVNNRAVDGAGLYENGGGNVILRNSMVLSNTATNDGGGFYLYDEGGLQIYQTVFRNNQATNDGGAINIEEESGLIVEDSAFLANSADEGGAIYLEDDNSVQIDRSTFHGNRAVREGGALDLDDSNGRIRNSTFSGNVAGEEGGAIHAFYYGYDLQNNTIVDNEAGLAGGGLYVNSQTNVALQNNIVAGNRVAGSYGHISADCSATDMGANVLSVSGNLFGTNTGCTATRFDQAIAGAQVLTMTLEPLADNGGVTLPDGTRPHTHNVRSGSSAIDFGDGTFCPTTDQRGTARSAGSRCDSGAVESSYSAIPFLVGNLIFVTTTVDDFTMNGNCTLREAIQSANMDIPIDACNAGRGLDVIFINAGTYTLALTGTTDLGGDLDISSPVIIQGADAASTIIDANQINRVFDINAAMVRLQNLTIKNGQSNANGGCIHNKDGFLAIENSVVTNCTTLGSAYGGGVFSDEGIFYLLNSTVSQNTSNNETGGVYNDYGVMVIEQGIIIRNTAQIYGGGVHNYYGSAQIVNTQILTNTANSRHSGGVYTYVGVTTIDNSQIRHNQTAGNGGGLGLEYGTFRVRNSTVSHNTAVGLGGGIHADEGIWLDNTVVEHNSASAEAGGMYGGGLITGSTIRNNITQGNSGGLSGWGILRNAAIHDNSSGASGGGIYAQNIMLFNSAVHNNSTSSGAGGGIAIIDSNRGAVYLHDSTIYNNTGTGVHATVTNGIVLRNSTVSGNNGGVYAQQGVVDVSNSTISGNNFGGGVKVDSGTLSLDFSTVVNNMATSGGGVRNGVSAETIIENSIVAGNNGGDCQADSPLQFAGHTLFGSGTGCTSTNSSDNTVAPATVFATHLGPLANNGGATTPAGNVQTHAPLAASGALDRIPLTHCNAATDQLAGARPFGLACDAGAVESQTFRYVMAVNDQFTTGENSSLLISTAAAGLLANDNPRNNRLAIVNSGPRTIGNGSLLLQADGTFLYSPYNNFSGTDTFTYTVSNGVIQESGIVTITVVPHMAIITFPTAGWHNFGYPLQGSRPITNALASISGTYGTVWNYDGAIATWRMYNPTTPSWTNTLHQLEYTKAYWIQMAQPATLALTSGRGVVGRASDDRQWSALTPPSAFYGKVNGVGAGQTIRAQIGGVDCGAATTFTHAGQTVYLLYVLSASEKAGCGTAGASIRVQVIGHSVGHMGTWNADAVQALDLISVQTVVTIQGVMAASDVPSGTSVGGALLLLLLLTFVAFRRSKTQK